MTTARKDIAAMVAAVLAVLAYLTTHESWNIWLIGDNHRWATGAIVLVGLVAFAATFPVKGGKTAYAVLAAAAVVLAGLAFATGSLTPLSLLVAAIVLVWLLAVARDAWQGTHHPSMG